LRSWQDRRSRHPLGRMLEPVAAPWAQLGDALPGLTQARSLDDEPQAAFDALRGYGEAVAAIEAVLLGKSPPADAIIAQMLAQRLGERLRVQDSSDAESNVREAARRQATDLLSRWPAPSAASAERRMFARLARGRLEGWARKGTAESL